MSVHLCTMQTLGITEARKRLPELVNKAYLSSKSFTITKGGIPMAKIIKVNKITEKKKYTNKEVEKAINELAGMWKSRWKGKTTEEVVEIIRRKAWRSHASRH